MFDIDRFVADCRAALAERSSEAIRDVVRRAVAEPDGILKVLGEPSGASAGVVFRAADLTILNVVWGARQWTLPHNHNHRAIIGMYGGGATTFCGACRTTPRRESRRRAPKSLRPRMSQRWARSSTWSPTCSATCPWRCTSTTDFMADRSAATGTQRS